MAYSMRLQEVMKALPKKLLPLVLFGLAVTSLFSVQPAQADYIVTLEQVGSNVVATGSGAINLTGLTFFSTGPSSAGMLAANGVILTGPTAVGSADAYITVSGPTSFGTNMLPTPASSGSGDLVGINGLSAFIIVPHGYVSGNALTSSATWNNATFASLGVTRGTYEWTWGTGANQTFTLQIGPVICSQGQGYWKNHPDQWPVTQLQLGNNVYDQQELLSILHQPVRGNGLVLLAHQEIAAKLNIANGADGSCIQQTLTDADALIGDLVVPPVGSGYLRPGDVSALADTLDQYNEGMLCAPECIDQEPEPTPTPRARPALHPRPH
jgi:hypothetical protein